MDLSLSFPLFLTSCLFVTGIITLFDKLFLRKRRLTDFKDEPKVVEYARAFFPVILLVWVVRSFIFQPYRVPTGSLEPTVVPGDLIAVDQFSYGVRLPITRSKIFSVGEPKTGDIALFHWPVNFPVIFVKRVIGIPGDHIVYKNKILYINGVEAKQTADGVGFDEYKGKAVEKRIENLNGIKHEIYIDPDDSPMRPLDITVPNGFYFMMGDNRDDSDDSRMWGFVPEHNLIGKAHYIWMNWNKTASWSKPLQWIRWNRLGTKL